MGQKEKEFGSNTGSTPVQKKKKTHCAIKIIMPTKIMAQSTLFSRSYKLTRWKLKDSEDPKNRLVENFIMRLSIL